LIQAITTSVKFRWNDTQSRVAQVKDEGEIWELMPSLMDENSLMVLDSWTALVESVKLKAAISNSVNLQDASLNEMRPVYQVSANICTALLQVIRAMPCHVIVCAHPDEYQHRVAPPGRKMADVKEKDMLVDWTKMVPMSTSRPQSLNMAKYFTDVAWMEVSPTGTRKLDFRTKDTRIAGGHFDGFEDTVKYSFAELVKIIGGTIPPKDALMPWLKILTPEEAAPPEAKVLEGGESGEVKSPSLVSAGIFGKR
jgi:hypothetical protein